MALPGITASRQDTPRVQLTMTTLSAAGQVTENGSAPHLAVELPRRIGGSNLHAIRDGIRVLRTMLRDRRSGVSGHLVQAARQLRRAARPLRTALAVAGQ